MHSDDEHLRVVSLEHLEAMCRRVSAPNAKFTIDKRTEFRLTVRLRQDGDQFAVYPLIPGKDGDHPRVVLTIVRVRNGTTDMFEKLLHTCPKLERSARGEWYVMAEERG